MKLIRIKCGDDNTWYLTPEETKVCKDILSGLFKKITVNNRGDVTGENIYKSVYKGVPYEIKCSITFEHSVAHGNEGTRRITTHLSFTGKDSKEGFELKKKLWDRFHVTMGLEGGAYCGLWNHDFHGDESPDFYTPQKYLKKYADALLKKYKELIAYSKQLEKE